MTLADIVRRLKDVLVVVDRECPNPTLSQDTPRAKIVSLMLDVSRAEVEQRTKG